PAQSTPVAVPVIASAPGIVTTTSWPSVVQRRADSPRRPHAAPSPGAARSRPAPDPPASAPGRSATTGARRPPTPPAPPPTPRAPAASAGRREQHGGGGGPRQACPILPDVDPDADHDYGPGPLGEDAAQLPAGREHVVRPFQDRLHAGRGAHRGRGGDPGQQ